MHRIRLVAEPGVLDDEARRTLDRLDRQTMGGSYPKDGAWWWLAYALDGSAVGFAGMHEIIESGPRKGVFLCRCGVLPDHRGHGLQRRLIALRERKARELGYPWAYTYVRRDNLPSGNNFLRRGWLMGPRWDGHVGHTFVYLKKRLREDG